MLILLVKNRFQLKVHIVRGLLDIYIVTRKTMHFLIQNLSSRTIKIQSGLSLTSEACRLYLETTCRCDWQYIVVCLLKECLLRFSRKRFLTFTVQTTCRFDFWHCCSLHDKLSISVFSRSFLSL